MKIAFMTESPGQGRYPNNFPNARTEIAWMIALEADHFNILQFEQVKGYDWVFLILPKGGTNLNCDGHELVDKPNRYSELYKMPFVQILKGNNKQVAYVQEGPVWYVNDFSVHDQFGFYNQLSECTAIFAHNVMDKAWYQGLFPEKPVHVMPTLLIEELISKITPEPKDECMIGGNFCRWYGGFQSYVVASEFNCPIFVPSMHAKRLYEDQVPNLTHLPYLTWIEWMKRLSQVSYAVHMMPTVAAGTFSLNCAYFGIPCIGNIRVDTQRHCFPGISVEAENVDGARYFAKKLKEDKKFYDDTSKNAKLFYRKQFGMDTYKAKLQKILNETIS